MLCIGVKSSLPFLDTSSALLRGSSCAPGMAHLPHLYGNIKQFRRYRTEGQRQQGKGIAGNGVSGGSMRQNLCT